MDKKTLIVLIALVVLVGGVVLLSKNHSHPATEQTGKMQVSASFYPLYFFASQIGGDKADVINITPADAEPHDYEPTAADIAKIEDSKMLVLNGGHLESWGDDIQKNLAGTDVSVVVAGDDLANQQVTEEGETITDPHIWLSPELAEKMVDTIAAGFAKSDPSNRDYYLSNAADLKTKISKIDSDYKAGLAECKQKNIITSHAAFGYLATAYGLHQVPITGLSPDAEPSPAQLADIAQFAKNNNVKYIFFESLVSPKLSETIANEVGAKTLVLNPIEGLTPDELSAGQTYLSVMESNLANLRTALECK
jgi:zinc transport system substrate-binding protein